VNHFARVFLACALLLAVVVGAANAADHRKRDGLYAAQEALGAINRVSAWCDTVDNSADNVWDSANVPVEISDLNATTLLNRNAVRFMMVRREESGSDILCLRPGSNANTATNDPLTESNGARLVSQYEGRHFNIKRIATTDTPELYVLASSGTQAYCVEAYWHD
jgi:hypothetical protein